MSVSNSLRAVATTLSSQPVLVLTGIVVAQTGLVSFQARLLLFALFGIDSLTLPVCCQFAGHTVVVENQRAVEGRTRSACVVGTNLLAVGNGLLVVLAGAVVFYRGFISTDDSDTAAPRSADTVGGTA